MQNENSKMTVFPCTRLKGEICLQGSKNSVLPIMAAAIVNKGVTIIENCPAIADVYTMMHLLIECGCTVVFESNTMIIDAGNADNGIFLSDESRKMRASVLMMGSCLARLGYFSMSYPGGCAIGKRPVDFHIKGMEALCAKVAVKNEIIHATAENGLTGAVIELPFPSVGATQNILIAATCAKGTTRILNASKEPEIWDLCDYLRRLGCSITGERTGELVIEGDEEEKSCDVRMVVPADRIVAGTMLAAVACTTGEIHIRNIEADRIRAIMELLGAVPHPSGVGVYLKLAKRPFMEKIISTAPFPGFPTDMQSIFLTLMSVSGTMGMMEETVFDTRFGVVEELNGLGADIVVEGNCAYVYGKNSLRGGYAKAADLRGGAALVLAGLVSEEPVTVGKCGHIYRGYENLAGSLRTLGAVILEE